MQPRKQVNRELFSASLSYAFDKFGVDRISELTNISQERLQKLAEGGKYPNILEFNSICKVCCLNREAY